MKIVIDIPKKQFDEIQKSNFITVGETYAKKLIDYIKKGAPLEQEPKMRHWIDNKVRKDLCNCSECGALSKAYSKYCPNCGAKMVEPQESEDRNDGYRVSN